MKLNTMILSAVFALVGASAMAQGDATAPKATDTVKKEEVKEVKEVKAADGKVEKTVKGKKKVKAEKAH